MKLLTTLVTTLLALSLWAGSTNHDANDKGRNNKPDRQQHDAQPKEKPDHDRDRDPNHGKGKGNDDHHDPRDCDDDRHHHGTPKPPKDPVGVPAVPTGLFAEAISLFQVNLTWTDNATNELGFKVERSLDGTNYAQIAQVLPNTTSSQRKNPTTITATEKVTTIITTRAIATMTGTSTATPNHRKILLAFLQHRPDCPRKPSLSFKST